MTETNGTALAVREFTDKQIEQRLEIAASSGFGLQGATKEQLNGLYLLAIKYDVDPLTDLTLFRDRPWFTIDGRVRMMRRHPEYLGYRCRPLSKDEKDAWGYAADEIVVECTIKTRTWGEISARGKVRPAEFANQPVARSHPQEMAEKRAIARASRMAFGQDVPDEDELDVVVAERDDPARIAADAKTYGKIFDGAYDLPEPKKKEEEDAAPYVPTDVRDVDDREVERQRRMEGLK